ncbi:O-antigen ligase family protein, partial [Candidatus Sumerlaeota bacterium]|nr:O-antigen ligase family protein [Candidatus Sumerlaeota bacterium]
LSRGSLMFGGGIVLLLILIEVWGAWREMRTHSNIQTTPETIIVGGAGMLVMILALTILIFSTSSLERVVERGGVSDELRERGRLELWRASLEALGHSPWLGLGLGGAEAALNRYSVLPMATVAVWSHNDYVQFLAEMGIPVASVCLLALAALLSRLTADLVRHLRQYPWSQGMMQRSAMTGVLITLAHSITDFHLRIPLVGFTFLILLGLAVNSGALLISPRMYARLVDLEVFMRPLRWLRILESHRSD